MIKYSKYPLTEMQVRLILVDRAKKGYNHVNFTGGEPTLFPNFLKLLSFTKRLGYKIYVWTNGTSFVSESFTKDALRYIDELSLSIHWFDQASCEQQTGHKKHFDLFNIIAKNIKNYNQNNFFFCNVVINKHNYKNTLKIIKFVKKSAYPIAQVLVSNIAPEGIADHNFKDLAFSLDIFKKDIPSIVDYTQKNNIILRFFWLPTCILWEEYEEYANDAHWEERHTIERYTNARGKVVLQDIFSPDNSRKRTFVEKCTDCKWKLTPCTWVFEKYLELYKF